MNVVSYFFLFPFFLLFLLYLSVVSFLMPLFAFSFRRPAAVVSLPISFFHSHCNFLLLSVLLTPVVVVSVVAAVVVVHLLCLMEKRPWEQEKMVATKRNEEG